MRHDETVRRVSLTAQLLAMQLVIVLLTLLAAGFVAVRLEEKSLRSTYAQRVLTTARSLATVPGVGDAYRSADPSRTLQPLAETVRQAAGATFVVFTNGSGVRYSHPDPAKVGRMVSTDPTVPLGGEDFVGTETGSLGSSLRAKVPVRDGRGAVVGTVSVGILESRISADLAGFLPALVGWLTAAAMLGAIGAALVTRLVRRRIFGLEPDQIGTLLQTRDAMLHGIREGVVAVDDVGRLALVNDEALRLLGLDHDPTGQPAGAVLEPDVVALLDARGPVTDQVVLAGERLLVANGTVARVGGRDVGSLVTLRDRTELFDALRALQGQRGITDALRAQAHEFSNHLHLLSGLMELGCHDEAGAFIARLGMGGTLLGGASLSQVDDTSVAALLVAKGAAARERGVTLSLDEESEVVDEVGDAVLTVLGNLVDNAVDAVGPGGHVQVHAHYPVPNGGLVLQVVDDGPGLPADLREVVFNRGMSGKTATTDHHGQGIGLALVARIVQRRGGRVSIGERAGGGAVFTVVLPALGVPATGRSDARLGVRAGGGGLR